MDQELKQINLGLVCALMFAMLIGIVACRATEPSRVTPTPLGASVPALPSQSASIWTRHAIGGGGGQTGIAIDPANTDIVYVTTDNGGIVKTTDGGNAWFSINNNLGNGLLDDIEMDPLNAQVLYVVAEVYSQRPSWSDDPVNGELYRTRDGGQTWEVVYAEGIGTGDRRCFGIAQWPSTKSLLIPYDPADPRRYDADGDNLTDAGAVFLVSGGSAGILGPVLIDLARSNLGTYYLLGRSSLPDPSDPDLDRVMTDRVALKNDLMKRMTQEKKKVTPVEVEQKLTSLERAASTLKTMKRIIDAGGNAHYLK